MSTLLAPAKLTVSLRLTGLRDDGFHLIDAEMVSLDLADRLTFDDQPGVRYVGEHAIATASGDDLVTKALALAGVTTGVEVTKMIPAGGGLGGGSSDAAAVLRWAGFDDLDAAARLGADIAYCIVGGRARVEGIGEVVTPLPHVDQTYTLLLPPFGCSTPAVYRRWDELGGPTGAGGNDLEPAAFDLEPRLHAWRDRLEQQTGQRARLAGSGSTLFVDGSHPGDGLVVVRTVPRSVGNDETDRP